MPVSKKDLRKVEPRSRSVGAESRGSDARYCLSWFLPSKLSLVDQRDQVQDTHSEGSAPWRTLTRILPLYGESCKSLINYPTIKMRFPKTEGQLPLHQF